MKIVHMCLGCFFPDNYSYQENMLPKFHKKLGYEVEVIASLVTFDESGKEAFLDQASVYQNEYDIKVTRLNYKSPVKVYKKLKRYIGTYEAIEAANPDILFIHGCQFMDIDVVVKYLKRRPNVQVYVDNHADFSNSATNWLSKNILHKFLWKRCAHSISTFTNKFYGVLPARVDFLVDIYKLPREMVELLVMGADDEQVEKVVDSKAYENIRKQYNISDSDFLIVTGGKIDKFKKQTLSLMEAVKNIDKANVKLIVFGSVTDELKIEVTELIDETKIHFAGWVNAEKSYEYFSAADLVVFPGRHSVFWEQVVGQGKPMLCKFWDGTDHIDLGGNVEFLYTDSVEEIIEKIQLLLSDDKYFDNMKKVAEEKGGKVFSYKEISKRSILL